MRVITGEAKGRKLIYPESKDIRPTSGMVKESIFSIIQSEVPAARVLDLFSGSGQLGIEALSRGAGSCVFVDLSKDAISVIKQNLSHTKLEDNARVVMGEVKSFITGCRDEFDIILLDPPYNKGLAAEILPLIEKITAERGVIVCECDVKEDLPEVVGELTVKKEYRYGKKKITTYRREEE